MSHSSPPKQSLIFEAPVSFFIGESATDALIAEFIRSGVEKPCCIVRANTGKNHVIHRLLQSITSKPIAMLHPSALSGLDQLESLAEQCAAQACDGILAIGNRKVQALAKLLRIRMSLTPEEFANLWNSGVIVNTAQNPIPLACLPYGDSDGNEAQTQVLFDGKQFEHQSLLPDFIGIDPRITALSTQAEIAANACTTLLNLITTFNDTDHMILDSWMASGFEFLQNALHNWTFSTQTRTSWKDISSDMVAAQCLSSVCAYNRGLSSIVRFVETLTIDGFSDRHQSAAGLLPILVTGIQQNFPQRYARLWEFLRQEDPKRFVEDWIGLANPRGVDQIIQTLCIGTYRLFENPSVLRDIKPVLTLLATGGEVLSSQSSGEPRRSST